MLITCDELMVSRSIHFFKLCKNIYYYIDKRLSHQREKKREVRYKGRKRKNVVFLLWAVGPLLYSHQFTSTCAHKLRCPFSHFSRSQNFFFPLNHVTLVFSCFWMCWINIINAPAAIAKRSWRKSFIIIKSVVFVWWWWWWRLWLCVKFGTFFGFSLSHLFSICFFFAFYATT